MDPKCIFPGQRPYEQVILILRRHWLILFGICLAFFFFALLPFIFFAVLDSFVMISNAWRNLFWFLTTIYFLIWWWGLFYRLTDYILDIWIVTDHRVVDIEQKGLFKRNIAEATLDNIQDITVHVNGILETFFTYGSIDIQTAGPMREILFQQVPNPVHIKDVILHLYNEYARQHKDGIEIHEL
ncbi:MAG: PH domain-containing protein [bacterium]|nr:PH domain-containing protein [bacterium]